MNTNPDNMQFPFAKEALEGLDTQVSQDWNREQIDAMHMQFVAQWRQSLSTLVPAEVKILAGDMALKTYEAFVLEAPSFADIQVFEIDALQTLCAWSFDTRWVAAAVDCLFGGAGIIPIRERSGKLTHIELGIRQRLLETMATAYEAAWQTAYPIRLQTLRQEQQLSSLRLTSHKDMVLHAQFAIHFNLLELRVDLCLPKRALDWQTPSTSRNTSETSGQPAGWSRSLQHQLYAKPVESVAVLCEKELSVAQLLSLSLGQVLPIDLSTPVRLMVDGVNLLSGRYGVRNGSYALKVEHMNEPPLPAPTEDFEGATSGQYLGSLDMPVQAQTDLANAAKALSQLDQQIQKSESEGDV
jgi:flagellar motor switch protein FliM